MSILDETVANFLSFTAGKKYKTIYADPPWQFQNRTGKVAPEHKRLNRYSTLTLEEIKSLPVSQVADEKCHLYLWVPNALLPDGLEVMKSWGFEYKTNLIWEKILIISRSGKHCIALWKAPFRFTESTSAQQGKRCQ